MRIVGYTYRADTFCTGCVLGQLPFSAGEDFDGWLDATGRMSPEENLGELAEAFGIDRFDERTFDSDYFPKVIFSTDDGDHICGDCGGEL